MRIYNICLMFEHFIPVIWKYIWPEICTKSFYWSVVPCFCFKFPTIFSCLYCLLKTLFYLFSELSLLSYITLLEKVLIEITFISVLYMN